MLKKGFHGFCMALAVLILSSLFESHIYVVSSLFIGFIAGSIPLILTDERPAFRQMRKGLPFGLIGILLMVGITWLNSQSPTAAVDPSAGDPVVFHRYDRHFGHVPAGHLRFHPATDPGCLSAGDHSHQGTTFPAADPGQEREEKGKYSWN